jgi:hypothetical protein
VNNTAHIPPRRATQQDYEELHPWSNGHPMRLSHQVDVNTDAPERAPQFVPDSASSAPEIGGQTGILPLLVGVVVVVAAVTAIALPSLIDNSFWSRFGSSIGILLLRRGPATVQLGH